MRLRLLITCVALVVVTGCESPAVIWDQPMSAPGDTANRMAESPPLPQDSARCEKSTAAASDGSEWYAAWLRRRSDSSVAVVASRSADSGHSWTQPGIVDSLDIAKLGCARPGPSIAASGGYVHIAYSLEAPEGFGVFFAHSMDSTRTFHSPMTVVYGDRLSAVATAAAGMLVAVAYEDPSGSGHRIDVAVSRTQGHTFAPRVRGSPDEMEAVLPEVAVRDSVVTISFSQPSGGSRIIRVGRVR
jgi:hypothetical protein